MRGLERHYWQISPGKCGCPGRRGNVYYCACWREGIAVDALREGKKECGPFRKTGSQDSNTGICCMQMQRKCEKGAPINFRRRSQ